jgi:quercetin dioxygenase-like cupin family protein
MSAFADVGALSPQQIWDGVRGRAVHGERLTLTVVELEAETLVPEHSHDNEQVGMVVTGSIIFRVGDEVRELGPGGTWCIGPHVPHEARTGPNRAVLVETFAPCRDDWKQLERGEPDDPWWPPQTDAGDAGGRPN